MHHMAFIAIDLVIYRSPLSRWFNNAAQWLLTYCPIIRIHAGRWFVLVGVSCYLAVYQWNSFKVTNTKVKRDGNLSSVPNILDHSDVKRTQ